MPHLQVASVRNKGRKKPKVRSCLLLLVSLTVVCDRSRSHHRSRMTDSRNIHCTCWPEIRRCRRPGELRWSAWSPPSQSRLPELIASEGDLPERSGLPERKVRSFKPPPPPGVVSPCTVPAQPLTYPGASRRFGRVCVSLRREETAGEQRDNCVHRQTERCKWRKRIWLAGRNVVGREIFWEMQRTGLQRASC